MACPGAAGCRMQSHQSTCTRERAWGRKRVARWWRARIVRRPASWSRTCNAVVASEDTPAGSEILGDLSLLICSDDSNASIGRLSARALALDFGDTRPNDAFDQRGRQRSVERELDRAFRCLEISEGVLESHQDGTAREQTDMIGEGGVPHEHVPVLECRHALANHLDGLARHNRPDCVAHLPQQFPRRCWSPREVSGDRGGASLHLDHLADCGVERTIANGKRCSRFRPGPRPDSQSYWGLLFS